MQLFVPTAKDKQKSENQEKVSNGISSTPCIEKQDSRKSSRSGSKYSELEIEKLACSLEALLSQNSSLSREKESNIEPDLSRCTSCLMNQNTSRVVNNPGGEEISKDNLVFEDEKIIALLASEIKVPDALLKKIELQDTGQKSEKETYSWDCKSNSEKLERFGAVKRVNSASLVENPSKKEDWKNTRCNSDVAWSPNVPIQNQTFSKSWKGSKHFNKGNSRIRLISSSNSLSSSLPRLTSHHSSSDEEWFEEIEEGDDDVLRMNEGAKETADVPENCGDKKGSKPATESLSSTDLVTDLDLGKVHDLESLPKSTVSCIKIDPSAKDCGETEKPFNGKSGNEVHKKKPQARGVTSQGVMESSVNTKHNKPKPLSILKRLTDGRKDPQNIESPTKNLVSSSNRESFETLIVDPIVDETELREKNGKSENCLSESDNGVTISSSSASKNMHIGDMSLSKTPNVIGVTTSTDSWETIELGVSKKLKEKHEKDDISLEEVKVGKKRHQRQELKKDKCVEDSGTDCCCILQ